MRYAFLILAGMAFTAVCAGATHQIVIVLLAGLLSAIMFKANKKQKDGNKG